MARWESDSRGRLEEAALALYAERGFEQTTVAEIAARAGLTERTYFRHFADKREVLFWGAGELQERIVSAVADAPATAAPLDVLATALETAAGTIFRGRRDHSRQRQAVVAAHTGLQERELIKLATLAAAVADALHQRGTSEPTATLAAETGITVFKVAFGRWLSDDNQHELALHIHELFAELKAVTAGD